MSITQGTWKTIVYVVISASVSGLGTAFYVGRNSVTKDDVRQAISDSQQVINSRITALETGSARTTIAIEQIQRDMSDQGRSQARVDAKLDILLQHSAKSN